MPVIALADLAAAVVVLVLVLAGFVLIAAERHLIPDWGIGSFNLRQAFIDVTTAGLAPLRTALRYLLRPLSVIVGGSMVLGWRLVAHGFNFIEAVPGKLASVLKAALATANTLAANLQGNINTTAANAQTATAAAAAGVLAVEQADARNLQGNINTAAANAAAEAAAAQAGATAVANTLAENLQHNITSVSDTAAAGVAGAESLARSLFTTAEADIQSGIRTLEADLSTTAEGLRGYAGTVADGAAAAAAAGVLAQVLPMVTSITTEVDQCLRPMCDTVTPRAPQLGRLGQFLQGLEGLGVDALVLALLVEAVHHPDAVVSEVDAIVHDVGDPILHGLRDVVGV